MTKMNLNFFFIFIRDKSFIPKFMFHLVFQLKITVKLKTNNKVSYT